jgi:drug/metabolite transporter (DMT)-like permease
MLSQRRLGLLWAFLAICGYAFLPIFTRKIYANSELIPTDIALWRFLIATPVIWIGIIASEQMTKKKPKSSDSGAQIFKMFLMGSLYAAAALCAFFGLQYIPASIYVVLFYTYPAFVVLISVFLGQRLRLAAWVALVLTLIGVVLTVPDLSLAGDNTTLGISIAILNALVVAVYFSIIGGVIKGAVSVTRASAWVITGTLGFLLLTIPFFGFHTPTNMMTWLLLIGLGIISTALPILLTILAIQAIGATQTSIVSTAEPILAMSLAFILLGETIVPIQWLGAAFIITGVIILEIRPSQKLAHLSVQYRK